MHFLNKLMLIFVEMETNRFYINSLVEENVCGWVSFNETHHKLYTGVVNTTDQIIAQLTAVLATLEVIKKRNLKESKIFSGCHLLRKAYNDMDIGEKSKKLYGSFLGEISQAIVDLNSGGNTVNLIFKLSRGYVAKTDPFVKKALRLNRKNRL